MPEGKSEAWKAGHAQGYEFGGCHSDTEYDNPYPYGSLEHRQFDEGFEVGIHAAWND